MYPNHIVPTRIQVVNTENIIVNVNVIKPEEFVGSNKVYKKKIYGSLNETNEYCRDQIYKSVQTSLCTDRDRYKVCQLGGFYCGTIVIFGDYCQTWVQLLLLLSLISFQV